MPPEDVSFLPGSETFVREFVLTLCIVKSNSHLYLVFAFDLSGNLRSARLVTDHYIAHLEIVSNVFNGGFLVNISVGISLFETFLAYRI